MLIHSVILPAVAYFLKERQREKEEEKVKEEEEVTAAPKLTGEGALRKNGSLPLIPDYCVYVYEVTKSILPITNIKRNRLRFLQSKLSVYICIFSFCKMFFRC